MKNILCPKCGRKVMRHDEKGTIEMFAKCRKCNLIVCYSPLTKKIKFVKSQMIDSSGKRFY